MPFSVAKMNFEDTFAVPLETWKFGPPLNTMPVGSSGTLTTSGLAIGNGFPSPSYSVDVLVPLFATQKGVVGPATRPQAFTRFESMCGRDVRLIRDERCHGVREILVLAMVMVPEELAEVASVRGSSAGRDQADR